jgi:hypothetical protein
MLEHKIRIISENLARVVDRRQFMQKTGSTMFAGLIALAAGHGLARNASAAGDRTPRIVNVPQCSPPGPYCNTNGTNEPNGCLNSQPGGPYSARCFQHYSSGQMLYCRVYYTYYQGGCWTRASNGGYWTCCDCECSVQPGGNRVATCGCAGFSLEPVPGPDSPVAVPSTARTKA